MIRGIRENIENNWRKALLALWLVLGTMLYSEHARAAEFLVKSFAKAENDLTARLAKFKRTDDNDMVCAIIKVRSDIQGLRFTASNPIVGNVEYRYGEYWVYISEGTRQLSIYADGFIKLSYVFPIRIEPATVYIMEVTAKTGTVMDIGKGNLIVDTDPSGAEVRIDGFPDLVKITPCRFENYRSGVYTFKFSKERYFPVDTVIGIEKQVTKQIFVKLHPRWGDLIVKTDGVSVFTINGQTYEDSVLELSGEKNGLSEGMYSLKISRDHYYDTLINVAVKAGDTVVLTVSLKPVLTNLNVRTSPVAAKIYLDGELLGVTPYAGKIITGSHQLKLVAPDYIEENREIILLPDEPFDLKVNLRTHAKVWVNSYPDGAKIYLNGEYKGKTPEKIDVYTGENTLRLTRKNYEDLVDTIVVVPDTVYRYVLRKRKYHLVLNSFPSGAGITINGSPSGTTNTSKDLTYGSYKIKFQKRGYVSRRKTINLKKDDRIKVRLPKRLTAYAGATFFIPEETYDVVKFGGELGWSYQALPHIVTGIGFALNNSEDENERLQSYELDKVSEKEFKNLHFSTMEPSDFAVVNANVYYLRLGVVAYKPFLLSLTSVMGVFLYDGFDVYTADKNYVPAVSINDPILEGDKMVNYYGLKSETILKYGLGALVKLGDFYVNMDYWFPSNTRNYGTRFSIGIGLIM